MTAAQTVAELHMLRKRCAELEEQLEVREKLLRELRHALRSAGFGPEYGGPSELAGLAAVIDATIGPTPVRPSEHPSLRASNPANSPNVTSLPVCPECAEGRHVYCLDDGSSIWTGKCRCTCGDESRPASRSDPTEERGEIQ